VCGVNMSMDNKKNAIGVKRRLAILSMATCVVLSGLVAVPGCGVRMGMEKVEDARQAKKQVEDVQHELQKDLKKGQDVPSGDQ
jgi:hypothetical protein